MRSRLGIHLSAVGTRSNQRKACPRRLIPAGAGRLRNGCRDFEPPGGIFKRSLRRTRPLLRAAGAVVLVVLLGLAPQAGTAAPQPALAAETGTIAADLRVRTPAYRLDAAGLHVTGYGADDRPGAPMLPVWSTIVELPATGAWQVSVDPGEARVIKLDRPLPAAPVPQPLPFAPLGYADEAARPDAVPTIQQPDPAIYAADRFYPANAVQADREQWQRGRRLLALRVFPFEYNPVAGVVRFHPDMRVTVRVAGAEARGQRSEVGGQGAEGRGQGSEVRGRRNRRRARVRCGSTPARAACTGSPTRG